MDFSRKGVVVSRTNLIENKKTVPLPWKGVMLTLILAGGVWGGNIFYLDYAEKELSKVQSELTNLRSGRDYEKMSSVADGSSRLVSIEKILSERMDWKKLFAELERNTTKEVTFSSMEASFAETDGASLLETPQSQGKKCLVNLTGETMGIANVSKQVAAFKDESSEETSFASKIKLDKVDLKETSSADGSVGMGNVEFMMSLEINPNIFKSTEEDN